MKTNLFRYFKPVIICGLGTEITVTGIQNERETVFFYGDVNVNLSLVYGEAFTQELNHADSRHVFYS